MDEELFAFIVEAIIFVLQIRIEELYDEMVTTTSETWDDMASSFNTGQEIIFLEYITPALEDWAQNEASEWPDAEAPLNYLEGMFECYDMDVMERAFSDAIELPVDEITHCAEEAERLNIIIDALSSFE